MDVSLLAADKPAWFPNYRLCLTTSLLVPCQHLLPQLKTPFWTSKLPTLKVGSIVVEGDQKQCFPCTKSKQPIMTALLTLPAADISLCLSSATPVDFLLLCVGKRIP